MDLLNKLTEELQDIIKAIGPSFREVDKKEIAELCEHGEQEIAFEVLCSQIGEFGTPISTEIFSRIKKLGEELNIDPLYTESIRNLVK